MKGIDILRIACRGGSEKIFQRDGRCVVISENAVGMTNYGLNLKERSEYDPTTRELTDPESVKTSEDLMGKGNRLVELVTFKGDDTLFSLESMNQLSRKFSGLRCENDDTALFKIVMVQHNTRYRNHKWGYGADGVDIDLAQARAIEHNLYLQLMGEEEDKLMTNLRKADQRDERGLGYFVLTKNLLLSFPVPVCLRNSEGNELSGWDKDSPVIQSRIEFERVNSNQRSPYALYIRSNHKMRILTDAKEFGGVVQDLAGGLKDDLERLNFIKHVAGYLSYLNDRHNEAFKSEIEKREGKSKAIRGSLLKKK